MESPVTTIELAEDVLQELLISQLKLTLNLQVERYLKSVEDYCTLACDEKFLALKSAVDNTAKLMQLIEDLDMDGAISLTRIARTDLDVDALYELSRHSEAEKPGD